MWVFGGDEDAITISDTMVNTIHVHDPRALKHVEDVIAWMGMQRKAGTRVHLDEIDPELYARLRESRHANPAPDPGECASAVIIHRAPGTVEQISNVLSIDEASQR